MKVLFFLLLSSLTVVQSFVTPLPKISVSQQVKSALSAATTTTTTTTTSQEIIPHEVLFGNPTFSSPKLSPDGKFIAYLAFSTDLNVMNVFFSTVEDEDARMINNFSVKDG
jgi:hypothetical protein